MFSKKTVSVALLIGVIIFLWGFIGFPWGNLSTQLISAFITVITGVFVFVFGQVTIRFFIDPLQSQLELIGDIAYNVSFYADLWGNPGSDSPEERREGSQKIRGLASKLNSLSSANTFYYPIIIRVNANLSHENVRIAHSELIGISNRFFARDRIQGSIRADMNLQSVHEIEEALGLSTSLGIDIEAIRAEMANN